MPVDVVAVVRENEVCLAKKIAKLNKPLVNKIIGHGEEQVDQLLANPLNFRLHPDNQQQALAGAIDDIGFIRSVTVNQRTGRVIDGHLRVTLAARSDVKSLPVEYVDLSEAEEAQALLSLDPIASMAATDKAKLDELLQSVQSEDERVQAMLAEMAEKEGAEFANNELPEEETEEELEQTFYRVPDAVWGTDNEFGIPLLDLSMQATSLEAPFIAWGTKSRKDKMTGTYHFYVGDERFEALWRDPLDVANSACNAAIEVNFSVYDDMPRAVAIWQMYRKRWLSRWFQSVGIRMFVDLNISHRHDNLRFVGVPKGWKSYATRAYSDRLDETVKEYEQALEHSEGESILFVCYGGGKAAEELSKKYGWIWYPDQQTSMKEVNYG